MTRSEIISRFVQEIVDGKCSLKDAKGKINHMEEKFGTDFFTDIEIEKKEKPWNKEYLDELEMMSLSGVCSRQFILHLAEVSEYIHKNIESEKKKKRNLICICLICLIILVGLVIRNISKEENENRNENDNNISESIVINDFEA